MAEIVITLKGGQGYEEPWAVIHADTPDQAENMLAQVVDNGLGAKGATASAAFRAQVLAARELGAVPVAVSRPVEATQSAGNVTSIQEASPISPPAPPVTQSAAQGPACKHGAMTFRTSKPGAAKEWKAWMCA